MVITFGWHGTIGEKDGAPGYLHIDAEAHTDQIGHALCSMDGIDVGRVLRNGLQAAADTLVVEIERAQKEGRLVE